MIKLIKYQDNYYKVLDSNYSQRILRFNIKHGFLILLVVDNYYKNNDISDIYTITDDIDKHCYFDCHHCNGVLCPTARRLNIPEFLSNECKPYFTKNVTKTFTII